MSEEEEGYGENHLIVHRPANDKFHRRLGVPDVHFEQPDGGEKKEPEPYYLVLKPSNKEGPIEEMRESMLSDIRELKARGANLICFNELSYPGFTYPIVDDSTFKTPSDLDLNNIRNKQKERDRAFRDEIQALANGTPGDDSDPPCIIVAGTFHDAATLRNICPIFFPETVNSDDSLYYHEKQTQALDYRKNGFLRLPKKREIPVYLTDLGTMMVHVCFDVVDLNLFMNQFRQPNRSGFQPAEVPAIVVVPAHTESDQVREACKDLSKSASCIVIYSNPLDTVTGAIFHCGATARAFDTQGIHYEGDSFGSSEAVENCNLVRRTRLEERESAQNTLSTIISPTG